MSYRIDLIYDAVEVRFGGRDALVLFRQSLAVPYVAIDRVRLEARTDLEGEIRGKRRAVGPPTGEQVGRKRLGTFLTGDDGVPEFWVVGASSPDQLVVVAEVRGQHWSRVVLLPDRVDEFVRVLQQQISRLR